MTKLESQINDILVNSGLEINGKDNLFYVRFIKNIDHICALFMGIYGSGSDEFLISLTNIMVDTWKNRAADLKNRDLEKSKKESWYTDHQIVGMSLYVDRFAGNLKNLSNKLDYFEELGVNFLHLMPVMESPENESDGGYAVSDFTKVDKRFGTNVDLIQLQQKLLKKDMYLMFDVVVNHTSHRHEWAEKAKQGNQKYIDYFYTYSDRTMPDQYEQMMPEIFPDSSPGSFTWSPELNKWVMTVFNSYQWDLNYTNPEVFLSMMETIFFYGNLGVDILRIDAPAFIWKKLGTTCQNLDEAHILLQLMRACTDIATPGMALLGEAIVAPQEIMKYFGTDTIKECSVAYNATQMATQWDALASGETGIMLHSQSDIYHKPMGCTWINYTRCHDDIGLGFSDDAIRQAGYSPFEHRSFIKKYYSGQFEGSSAKGLLFGVNPKTQDARISGSLASLCGLEHALLSKDNKQLDLAIAKICLMQANSILLGGIPMLFYGDEVGYTNDYSYESDPGKSYDNRWAHRPMIDWDKNEKRKIKATFENKVFESTQKLIQIRKDHACISDQNNLIWLDCKNKHLIGFKRMIEGKELIAIFNYSPYQIKWADYVPFFDYSSYKDVWNNDKNIEAYLQKSLIFDPYTFKVLVNH